MTRKHKPQPPLPALSPHSAQREFQAVEEWTFSCMDCLNPFFPIVDNGHCGFYLLCMLFMSLLLPLENSFCAPWGPWEVSVMMPCCPNTTSGGYTGSPDYPGWSRVRHFHPRDWFRDGHVLQTRPIGWYPGTDPEPWKREVFCGWLNLLLLILHLSLHPLPLLCNFAVPPIKMQNVFPAPSLWTWSDGFLVKGILVNLPICTSFFVLRRSSLE